VLRWRGSTSVEVLPLFLIPKHTLSLYAGSIQESPRWRLNTTGNPWQWIRTRKGPLIDFLSHEVTAENASPGGSLWRRSHLRLVGDRSCDHSLVQCDWRRKGPSPRSGFFSYAWRRGGDFLRKWRILKQKGALLPPRRIKET